MAKELSYQDMFFKLKERFPTIIVKDNNEFTKDCAKGVAFWLPNGNEVTYTDKDESVLCSLDVWVKNPNDYEIDVYKKFDKWCNRYGWYASTENYALNIFKN